MSDESSNPTALPPALRQQLEDFRRKLWRTKIAEAIWLACFFVRFWAAGADVATSENASKT